MPVNVVENLPALPTQDDFGPVTAYGIATGYEWDKGLVGLPVAGPDRTPCKVLRLHGGICCKVIRWVAQRIAQKAALPSWDTQSPNEILMWKKISSDLPGTMVDGTTVWSRVGEYRYLLLVPPADTDDLAGSAPPWSAVSAPYCTVTADEFSTTIVAPVPAVTPP